MPQPAQRDHLFLERRKARRSVGLFMFPLALAAVVGSWVALFVFWPLAVNPFTVVGQIEQQTFEPGTLTMYAVSATVLMNVVLALISVGLTFGMLWARHERRYHKLLEQNVSRPDPKSISGV